MLKYISVIIYIKFLRIKSLVIIALHADIFIQSSTSSFFDFSGLFSIYSFLFVLLEFNIYFSLFL